MGKNYRKREFQKNILTPAEIKKVQDANLEHKELVKELKELNKKESANGSLYSHSKHIRYYPPQAFNNLPAPTPEPENIVDDATQKQIETVRAIAEMYFANPRKLAMLFFVTLYGRNYTSADFQLSFDMATFCESAKNRRLLAKQFPQLEPLLILQQWKQN
jgi:hypothetical protein